MIKELGELANCQTWTWSNIFGDRPNVKCWSEVSQEVDFHWIEIHGVFLNHCALVTPYDDTNLGQYCLPDGTTPMLTNHHRCSMAFIWEYFHSTYSLTHWGRVTHICVGKIIIIGSDNGLSPDRRQAIIWTNAGLFSIEPLRTYFSENLIKIQPFSLKKMHVKTSSAKWRPSCLGLNVLT